MTRILQEDTKYTSAIKHLDLIHKVTLMCNRWRCERGGAGYRWRCEHWRHHATR